MWCAIWSFFLLCIQIISQYEDFSSNIGTPKYCILYLHGIPIFQFQSNYQKSIKKTNVIIVCLHFTKVYLLSLHTRNLLSQILNLSQILHVSKLCSPTAAQTMCSNQVYQSSKLFLAQYVNFVPQIWEQTWWDFVGFLLQPNRNKGFNGQQYGISSHYLSGGPWFRRYHFDYSLSWAQAVSGHFHKWSRLDPSWVVLKGKDWPNFSPVIELTVWWQ